MSNPKDIERGDGKRERIRAWMLANPLAKRTAKIIFRALPDLGLHERQIHRHLAVIQGDDEKRHHSALSAADSSAPLTHADDHGNAASIKQPEPSASLLLPGGAGDAVRPESIKPLSADRPRGAFNVEAWKTSPGARRRSTSTLFGSLGVKPREYDRLAAFKEKPPRPGDDPIREPEFL